MKDKDLNEDLKQWETSERYTPDSNFYHERLDEGPPAKQGKLTGMVIDLLKFFKGVKTWKF